MSNHAHITATGSFVNISIDKKKKSKSPHKSPTKASASPSKDKFSNFNRESLLGESSRRKSVSDRMKEYGRFLKYEGVAYLKPELKRIYHNE